MRVYWWESGGWQDYEWYTPHLSGTVYQGYEGIDTPYVWLNLDYPLLSGHLLVAEDRSWIPWMVELMYDWFDVYVGQRFSPAKVKRNPHYLRQSPDTPPPLYLPPKLGGVNVGGVYDLGDNPPRWPGRPDLSHIDHTLPDETLKRITRDFECTAANRTGWIGRLLGSLDRAKYCSACSAQCGTSCESDPDEYLSCVLACAARYKKCLSTGKF